MRISLLVEILSKGLVGGVGRKEEGCWLRASHPPFSSLLSAHHGLGMEASIQTDHLEPAPSGIADRYDRTTQWYLTRCMMSEVAI
jgi:hypothetical protein